MGRVDHEKLVASFSVLVSALPAEPGVFSSGWGLDPDRTGPMGLIVYAASNDAAERERLVSVARAKLPSVWEGCPVYFKGIPVYH